MWLILCQFIIGIGLLAWSADRFVVGAANVARNLGMSPLLIGLTIVSIGTSAPEIVIAIVAALQHQTDLVIGNAIGSNITNIGLGVGLIALISPLRVRSTMLRKEYPILFLITILLGLFLINGTLSRIDGIILLISFGLIMAWFIYQAHTYKDDLDTQHSFSNEIHHHISTKRALFWLIIGGILLPISARILVLAAVMFSQRMGISQLVIGLTIIAIGTSLPEIAASLMGALRKEYDISIGNILGSNMMNIALVLGLPAVITPMPVAEMVLYRDYMVMFGLTILLFITSYSRRHHGQITRAEGSIILACYSAYLIWLIF